MKKLIALYKRPEDVDAFLKYYADVHMPLADKIPGLLRTEVTRIDRTLMGEDGTFLLAELYFADEQSVRAALKSPENAAAAADASALAPGLLTIMAGEVLEL